MKYMRCKKPLLEDRYKATKSDVNISLIFPQRIPKIFIHNLKLGKNFRILLDRKIGNRTNCNL